MQGAQNDVALRQTVRHLVEVGARKQEIIEAIGQMSMFAGVPAMTRAMQLAQDVMEDKEEKDT
jgi:4-carboxymuconolactone decarboxylase